MGLFQVFSNGFPKSQCCGFLAALQRCQASAWPLAIGPRCFFPERGLFSLETLVANHSSMAMVVRLEERVSG